MKTTHDVLRQHGLHDLADWAENPALAPQYAAQSAYWASVLSAPAMRDFAEWEMREAREFEFDPAPEPELPEPSCPYHKQYLRAFLALGSSIQPRIRHRRCLSECGHAACTARTNQPPGVDQGSISC